MKKRYGEEQIVQMLREADTAPTKSDVCRWRLRTPGSRGWWRSKR